MTTKDRRDVLRIVSLAPSATSILVALGARRQLAGVTKWCPQVADVRRLPRLGDCWSLDPQSVAKLRPTLVIGSVPYKEETMAQLLRQPVTFLGMNPRTLADIAADIQLLGRIAGREAAAKKLITKMQQVFSELAAQARRARTRPRVYCEVWPHPRISSPPWVAEMVRIAGGRMVVRAAARVTDEEVARARPDVIVIAWAATGARPKADATLALPAWRDVPAVRHGRVHVVRDEILNTPGPPLMDGVQELFRLIHPEHGEMKRARA